MIPTVHRWLNRLGQVSLVPGQHTSLFLGYCERCGVQMPSKRDAGSGTFHCSACEADPPAEARPAEDDA